MRCPVCGLDGNDVTVVLQLRVGVRAGDAGRVDPNCDRDRHRRADRAVPVLVRGGPVPRVIPVRAVEVTERQALDLLSDDKDLAPALFGEISARLSAVPALSRPGENKRCFTRQLVTGWKIAHLSKSTVASRKCMEQRVRS